jgi:hypothetical protein
LNFPRIIRLLLRGKINPFKTFLLIKTAAAAPARRILNGKAWRR